jgi:glycosyltransferase involved in cell wall biosynthesis
MWKAADVVRNVPTLPNLTGLEWDRMPETMPSLTVVVPARDEEANLAATLDALLLADYPKLEILVIDDRSTDKTGMIADAYEQETANRKQETGRAQPKLRVIHVQELPEGWLGKTFALEVGTDNSESDYLLYTDADVLFSPSILRRSVAFAESTRADHLVVMPTAQVKSWGEGVVLGFFQVLGVWASRLWKVSDPKTKDFLGVGAFNMVRRSAMAELGGWEPQRLAVLEDLTLGMRMKFGGKRQRVAYAPGLILVHWASGAFGLVRVMTKNLFSAFNFNPLLLAGSVGWLVVFCLLPIVGLFWWATLLPVLLTLCSIGATYRVMGEVSLIDARFGWLYPLGAMAFIWAMVRSMVAVLWRGGVVWRGTHYSLRELRKHNSPWKWRRAR